MDLYDLDIRSCSSEDGKNRLSPYKYSYELVVERDGQIIKYGSDTEAVALPEIFFNKVVELPNSERKENFIVIFNNNEIQELSEEESVQHDTETDDESTTGCKYILFSNGIPDHVGEVDYSIIEAAESYKLYVINEIKAEDLLKKSSVNFTKIEIDLSDPQLIQPYLLKSKFRKLLDNKLAVAKAVIGLVVAFVAGYFVWNETQDFTQQVIYKEEHREVDEYSDYRKEVANTYNSALVTNALLNTWVSLHHLPEGWKAPVIVFKNGLVSSEVKHDGGTIKSLDEFITTSLIKSSFNREGLSTVSTVEVKKEMRKHIGLRIGKVFRTTKTISST